MTVPIRVDVVLREAIATPYRDLVTRPTGVAVRRQLLVHLRETPGERADLDFTEVGLIDFSCADEVVAKFLIETAEWPLACITLRGIREDHADAITQVLTRYAMVVVALLAESPEPRLLGAADDDWRAAFGTLRELGRSPAEQVAARLTWPADRAAQALVALARQRCVVAHGDHTFELGAVA